MTVSYEPCTIHEGRCSCTMTGIVRPDIGECWCKPDAPDRCRWDSALRTWVGPCTPPVHPLRSEAS